MAKPDIKPVLRNDRGVHYAPRMNRLFFVLLSVLYAPSLLAQPTVFIVRHAEKATGGDARDPDLSEAGHARAQALAVVLKDSGIKAIYATEFKRTQQTAEPLARAAGLEITIVPGKEIDALAARLKNSHGTALIVAHSNTIPDILKALGAAAPPPIDETDYDNLVLLLPGPPVQLLRLHYR
ncbi:MAG TPA: histidine phosphatase family protein [Chthoniobacterales bacterium]|nr:histidine phosphatase family protein [Chthoniobacterales bacterium]